MSDRKVRYFEDLEVWQEARRLARLMREATAAASFRRDLSMSDQMRRAALSVMSNIAEGFESGSDAEFARYVSLAKASCGELRSLLYHGLDVGLLPQKDFDAAKIHCEKVSKMLWALMRYLRSSATAPVATRKRKHDEA